MLPATLSAKSLLLQGIIIFIVAVIVMILWAIVGTRIVGWTTGKVAEMTGTGGGTNEIDVDAIGD